MKLWYLLDEACTKTVNTCHRFVRICREVDWWIGRLLRGINRGSISQVSITAIHYSEHEE